MHEKSKGEADINRAGTKEHSLNEYDKEDCNSEAFKEVLGHDESGKGYEGNIASEESGENDL